MKHDTSHQRPLKVAELLKKVLSEIFLKEGLYHPDHGEIAITISEVNVSPDLKNATIYILPLANQNVPDLTAFLDDNMNFIRKMLAQKVMLRTLPKLYFKPDTAFDHAHKINSIFDSLDTVK